MQNSLQKWTLFSLAALMLGLSACKKDNTAPETIVLNDDEVSALLEGSLSVTTLGLAQETRDGAFLANQYTVKTLNGPCGESFDTTINYNLALAWLTANYNLAWDWTVGCTGQIPTSLTYNRSMTGAYETQRMRSSDSASSNWLIEGFIQSPDYLLSGNYTRNGSQESLVREQNSFTSKIVFNVPEVRVNKTTRKITGGTATLLITGDHSSGRAFRLEGAIVFNGNGTATVTANGRTYVIDLY